MKLAHLVSTDCVDCTTGEGMLYWLRAFRVQEYLIKGAACMDDTCVMFRRYVSEWETRAQRLAIALGIYDVYAVLAQDSLDFRSQD